MLDTPPTSAMLPVMRRLIPLLALLLAVPAVAAPAPSLSNADKAEMFYRAALARLVTDNVEQRRTAIEELETALTLVPDRVEYVVALGRAQQLSGFHLEARATFDRAITLAPREPAAYVELGAAWKREWLKYLEPAALRSALAACEQVTQLRPYSCDAWLALVPLRFENGDLKGAADAAERSWRARPGRADARAALACLAYRRGEPERADSLFRSAIPQMTGGLRALYEDIAPVAGNDDLAQLESLDPAARTVFIEGFWDRIDPDPTTPENEAQLEYWSRATHAALLFRDPLEAELDARAQVYLRYGPPARVTYNPLGERLWFNYKLVDPLAARSGGRSQTYSYYPVNALVWEYPDVGMRIVLQDRTLNGSYDLAFDRVPDPRSEPNRALLARRDDLISTGAGRGLFPTLPPRSQRLEVRGLVARFAGERGPRLFAQIDVPAAPADSVFARWIVEDKDGHDVAHGASVFATSGCDPAERRVAEVAADLAPGDYTVIVSARDQQRRRGLYRAAARIEPSQRGVAMSDLVLTCGTAGAGADAIRLDANLARAVPDGQMLSAYFEVYGLAQGLDGVAKFEYEYHVMPAEIAQKNWWQRTFSFPSAANIVTVQREEMQRSSLRRQFLNVPVQQLKPGLYRLEVRVRDRVGGTSIAHSVEFERLPPANASRLAAPTGPPSK